MKAKFVCDDCGFALSILKLGFPDPKNGPQTIVAIVGVRDYGVQPVIAPVKLDDNKDLAVRIRRILRVRAFYQDLWQQEADACHCCAPLDELSPGGWHRFAPY
jgi:hypothetical protein